MPASTRRASRPAVLHPTPPVGPPTEPAGAPPLEPERKSMFRRDAEPRSTRPARPGHKRAAEASWPWVDLVIAAAIAVAAAFIAATRPAGGLRLALGLAMLLFVPGYLLLQAFAVPAAKGTQRLWQALGALGISPALVGVLALATSIVQGGFRLDAIVILVTLACLGFAATALVRRRSLAHASAGSDAPQPQAATAKSGPVRP